MTTESAPRVTSRDAATLSVWDAGSLIVGIVIGASLFRVPANVFGNVATATGGLGLWLAGGLLSLAGALCYCELATTYPRLGGDYVYLSHAYGRWMGFLYGWMRFTVIIPANIGAMAFIFAEHAARLASFAGVSEAALALGAIAVLTLLNLWGVVLGARVQNTLTLFKLAGLAAIVIAGGTLLLQTGPESPRPLPPQAASAPNYGLALVFVLYAYGGWSDAAFVAAEVRDVRRNIPRALLLGLGTITIVYLLVNCAYLAGLGLEGVRQFSTPAAELLQRSWGSTGEVGVILIVMLSTLGAINGMIFSGARLTAAVGDEHRLFAFGRAGAEVGNPWRAVLAIGAMSTVLVWLVGTAGGVRMMTAVVRSLGRGEWNIAAGEKGFDTLVTGTAPVFWLFFCLTALAVPLLRRRDPQRERPFRCGSPLMPAIFGATSAFMLWSSFNYARGLALLGVAVLLAGILLLPFGRRPMTAQPPS